MKELAEILANFKPSREYVYGDPDTMKITYLDVCEWINTSAGIDIYMNNND